MLMVHPYWPGNRSNMLCVCSCRRTEIEVPVPLEICWSLWEDRERIPQWMPWIKTVTVQKDNPALSRWTLAQNMFGRLVLQRWTTLRISVPAVGVFTAVCEQHNVCEEDIRL